MQSCVAMTTEDDSVVVATSVVNFAMLVSNNKRFG
jgi:hypothetical protein